MALTFDTLQYVKKLKEAGVPEQQAEVQAEALAEIIDDKLATKQDLKKVESSLKFELKELEHTLEVKISNLKYELVKWIFGASITQAAIIISCIKFIH